MLMSLCERTLEKGRIRLIEKFRGQKYARPPFFQMADIKFGNFVG